MMRYFLPVGLLAAFGLLCCAAADAAICEFSPTGAAPWEVPANWNNCGGNFPGPSDRAIINNGGTATTSSAITVFELEIGGGSGLTLGSDMTVTNLLDWSGGAINVSTPGVILTLDSTGTGSITRTPLLDGVNFTNLGTLNLLNPTVNDGGELRFANNAVLNNSGEVVFQNNSGEVRNIDCDNGANCGTINNLIGGTWRFDVPNGILGIDRLTAFNNAGVVELSGAGCAVIAVPGTDVGGTYQTNSSCTLGLSVPFAQQRVLDSVVHNSISGGLQFQGPGTVVVTGGPMTLRDSIIGENATITGDVNLNLVGFTIYRGTIDGTGPSLTVTVPSVSLVSLASGRPGTGNPLLRNRTLVIDGALDNSLDSAVGLDFGLNSLLQINASAGLIGSRTGEGFRCVDAPSCGAVEITAPGQLVLNGGTSIPFVVNSSLGSFSNAGSLQVDFGTLQLDEPYIDAGGTLQIADGANISHGGTLQFNAGGRIFGAGVLNTDIECGNCTIEPAPDSVLTINGDYTETGSNSRLIFNLAGPEPGSYSRMLIRGSANFNAGSGGVDAMQVTPFVASGGDEFSLIEVGGAINIASPPIPLVNVVGSPPSDDFQLEQRGRFIVLRDIGITSLSCTWTGLVSGNWNAIGNWTNCSNPTPNIPQPGDTAIINGGTPNDPVIPLGTTNIAGLIVSGGALISGSGPSDRVNVTQRLEFESGRFSDMTLALQSSATGAFHGAQKEFDGATFLHFGQTQWSGGLIDLANGSTFLIGDASRFIANPGLSVEAVQSIDSATNTVNIEGLLQKIGPGEVQIGQTTANRVTVNMGSSGEVQIDEGTLAIRGDGNFDGLVEPNGVGRLELYDGNINLSSLSGISGNGAMIFGASMAPNSGTYSINGNYEHTGFVEVRHGEVLFAPTTVPFIFSSTVSLLSPNSLLRFAVNAELSSLNWFGGTIRGDGQTWNLLVHQANFGDLFQTSFPRSLSFINFELSQFGYWYSREALDLDANSTLNALSGARLQFLPNTRGLCEITGGGSVVIAGLMTTNDDCDVLRVGSRFVNIGVVEVASGNRLEVQGNGNDSGVYAIQDFGGLRFSSASRVLDPPVQFLLAGPWVTAGTTQYAGGNLPSLRVEGGQFDYLSSPLDIHVLELAGGQISALLPNSLTISGQFDWTAGEFAPNSGFHLLNGANSTWSSPATKVLHASLARISGNVNWTGGPLEYRGASQISVENGALMTIDAGTIDPPSATCNACTSSPWEIQLGGTVRKTGTGTFIVADGIAPSIAGLLEVSDGTFDVGSSSLTGDLSLNGRYGRAGGSLGVSGGVISGIGEINSGGVDLIGGAIEPGINPGGAGTLNFTGDVTADSATQLVLDVGGELPGQHDLLQFNRFSVDDTEVFLQDTTPSGLPGTAQIELIQTVNGITGLVLEGGPPPPPSGQLQLVVNPFTGFSFVQEPNRAVLRGPSVADYVVDTVSDASVGSCTSSPGDCSLRDAITLANADVPTPRVIGFDIPGVGPHTISLASCLPQITGVVAIDGYTQPGSSPNTAIPGSANDAVIQIELSPQTLALPECDDGLSARGDVSIRGLSVTGFSSSGIVVEDLAAQIDGNWLGVRPDGSALGNVSGIRINEVGSGLALVTIGGALPAEFNVISGNASSGIALVSIASSADVVINGNLIGMAPDLSAVMPNFFGITVAELGAVNTNALRIGLAGTGNIIAGNTGDGLLFVGATPIAPIIEANKIGLERPGPLVFGNGGHGINVLDGAGPVEIGGETDPMLANIIQFNGGHGIQIGEFLSTPIGTQPVSVGINQFKANALLPVKLYTGSFAAERLSNDAGDSDSLGINPLQNFPVIAGWTEVSGPSLNIDFQVESANYPVVVDFYFAESFGGQSDEPTQYLGSMSVSGAIPQVLNVTGYTGFGPSTVIVGIARDGSGNSSEVSFYGDPSTLVAATSPTSSISGSNYNANVSFDPIETGLNPTVPVAITDGQTGCVTGDLSGFNPSTATCVLSTTGNGVINVTAQINPFQTPYANTLTGGPLSAQTAHTIVPAGPAVCTWDGSVGSWDSPSQWLNCASGSGTVPGTPGAADTAIVNSGSVTLVSNTAVGSLQQGGGTVEGAGFDLTVSSALTLSGGTQQGNGTTRVSSIATADLTGTWTLDARTLEIEGSTTWNGGTATLVDSSTAMTFNGPMSTTLNVGTPLLRIQCTGSCANARMVLFGSAEWTLGGGAFQVNVDGLSEFVNQGRIAIGNDFSLLITAPGGLADAGNYDLTSSTSLVSFAGDRVFENIRAQRPPGPGTTLSGLGRAQFRSGQFRFALDTVGLLFDALTSTMEIQSPASVDMDGSVGVIVGNLVVQGALGGTSPLISTNTSCDLNGAVVDGGSGSSLICAGINLLRGGNQFDGRALDLATGTGGATTDWLNGDLDFSNDAYLQVRDLAVLNSAAVNNANLTCTGSPCATQLLRLDNATLDVVGSGFQMLGFALDSFDSTVRIGSAAVVMSDFQQGGASRLELASSSSRLEASTISISGGDLAGIGTLSGNVSVGGRLLPGLVNGVGLLSIDGNLSLTLDATVDMELASPVAFDQIAVTSTLNFGDIRGPLQGSTLNISGIGGFTPQPIDNFTLFTFADRSGSVFTFVNNDFDTSHDFIYSPTSAGLQGIVTPGEVSISDAAVVEGNSGTSTLNFTISISSAPLSPVSVDWATFAGSAVAPGDFQAASGQVQFIPNGLTTQTVAITALGDVVYEGNETFEVRLSNLTGPGSILDGVGVGTISNDDAAPVLVIEDAAFVEGSTGGFTNAFFVIRRTGLTEVGTQVGFATADGDGVGTPAATEPADYVARLLTTVNFGPLETVKVVAIQLVADLDGEPSEAFFGRLSGAMDATISDGEGVMTILNDDGQAFTMTTGCGVGVEESAGVARIEVNRNLTKQAGSVRYATARITALEGLDYTPVSGILEWPSGDESPRFIEVPILEDTLVESTKSFLVLLNIPSAGYVIGAPGETLVEIFDNDDRIFGNGGDPATCLPPAP